MGLAINQEKNYYWDNNTIYDKLHDVGYILDTMQLSLDLKIKLYKEVKSLDTVKARGIKSLLEVDYPECCI